MKPPPITIDVVDANNLDGDKRTRDEIKEAERRAAAQRDGWREIGEALIATAFGTDMKGFTETPPTELLAAVKERGETEVISALQAGLLGRAWRVAGPDGEGTCDYPLCPHRAAGLAKDKSPSLARVELRKRNATLSDAVLRVCAVDRPDLPDRHGDGECRAWAVWVARRFANGAIKVDR